MLRSMGFDMRKIVRFSSDTGIAIVHVSIYIYVLSIELLKCVCKKYYTFENVYTIKLQNYIVFANYKAQSSQARSHACYTKT